MNEEKYYFYEHGLRKISFKELRTLSDEDLENWLDDLVSEAYTDGIYAERESNEW